MLLLWIIIVICCVWHSFLSVHCSIIVTCWERADLLCAMFYCVFIAFLCGVLCQVWYLIVSIPDLCLLTYFDPQCNCCWCLALRKASCGLFLTSLSVGSGWFEGSWLSQLSSYSSWGNYHWFPHLGDVCHPGPPMEGSSIQTCWRADLLKFDCFDSLNPSQQFFSCFMRSSWVEPVLSSG